MRGVAILALVSFFCSAASAASFNCLGPLSQIEALICGDAALSRADEKLATVYDAALLLSPDPDLLRMEERFWLKTRSNNGDGKPETLLRAYSRRISTLEAQVAAWRSTMHPLTEADAASVCAQIPDSPVNDCHVVEFTDVEGSQDGSLRYQRQAYGDTDERGIVVFQKIMGQKPSFLPIAIGYHEFAHFDKVALIKFGPTQLIEISGGSGMHERFSRLFAYKSGQATEINTEAWHQDLERFIPKGFFLAADITPDYSTMTATAVFTKGGDPYCCASGYAIASVHLRIANDKVVLVSDRIRVSNKPID